MAIRPVRLTNPWITLNGVDFTCMCAGVHLVPEEDDALATLCDPYGYAWLLTLDLKQSVGPGSCDEALWSLGGPGTIVNFEFAYDKAASSAANPHWTGQARLPAWAVVDAGINEPTDITLEMDVIANVTRAPTAPTAKSQAAPGSVFATEATVTAEDATNAAKLTGLGYVAVPTTAWTTGQAITILPTYQFNWSGTAWAAGAHA